jgi:hypothetical protein
MDPMGLGNSSDEVSIEIIGDHPQSHVGMFFLHPSKPRAGFGSSGGMFFCVLKVGGFHNKTFIGLI